MRSKVLRGSASLALAALLACGAAAAVPSPEPNPGAAGNPPEAKAAEAGEGEYKLVCRREPSTGSFLSTEKTCRKVRKGKRSAPEAG